MRLAGKTEGVCPELILGLFETEGFSSVGVFIASKHESPARSQSGLLVALGSLGPNLFTPSVDRRQEEGVTDLSVTVASCSPGILAKNASCIVLRSHPRKKSSPCEHKPKL